MEFEEIIKAINKTPYYQDDAVVIYHADCRDILPLIPDKSIDLVLTDPPYLNLKGGLCRNIGTNNPHNISVGDNWQANIDWLSLVQSKVNLGLIIFASFANVSPVIQSIGNDMLIGIATWLKRNSAPAIRNVPNYNTEFILFFKLGVGLEWHGLPTFFDIPTLNHVSNERFKDIEGIAIHPTQKPETLIMRLLKITEGIILDPFLGSGTTAYCAKKLGRKCIGIEIEEKYCEIAAKRCSQSVMKLEV